MATACETPWGAAQVPDDVAVPQTVGIISFIEQGRAGASVTLQEGGKVLLPNGAPDLTGAAEVGRLLIMGEGRPAAPDGGVWYAAVPLWPQGCFYLESNGEIRGDRMALSLGFTLPLSDEWDEAEAWFVEYPTIGFCLDDSGAVVRPYS